MAKILDLFSRRKQEQERSGQPDVYQYTSIPDHVINQIVMILDDAIGRYWVYSGGYEDPPAHANDNWDFIIESLAREYGDPSLIQKNNRSACVHFLKMQPEIEKQLDLIELSFRLIDMHARKISDHTQRSRGATISADDAIYELNHRLRRGGVGYQFEGGVIIRLDSEYIHTEVVKKALSLLHTEQFSGVEEEFLSAHKHYRDGDYKDAIVDAGAAFESTLKTICDRQRWEYDSKARVSDLLKVVRNKGLFPNYLDNSFDQLLAILKTGLPEVRNNEGSHGQGSTPKQAPGHIAAYALHLAATNIVFLVECMNDLQTNP